MSTERYTYCVLKYVHDAVADESLNIGVVLLAPQSGYLDVRLDERHKRLSTAFASFQPKPFRSAMRNFRLGVDRLRAQMQGLEGLADTYEDVGVVIKRIWPDMDLCFRGGPVCCGRTPSPVQELDYLFQRFVVSQYAKPKEEHRSNDEVWAQVYRRPLATVTPHLEPRTFTAPDFELEIPHAFKNGSWHAFQALSFDLSGPEYIARKAAQWHGNLGLIGKSDELGKIYFLLGKPSDPALFPAYQKAKNILDRVDVPHQIVEEQDAERFGKEVTAKIEAHLAKTAKTK